MSDFEKEFEQLLKEKEELNKLIEPFRSRRDALAAQIAPIQQEMRELAVHIHSLQLPRMQQIDMRLSELTRMMGGRRIGVS